MNMIWHNGAVIPDGPVFDLSDRIRLGDGVFDTMLAVDGKPVFAAEHFERLLRDAAVMGMDEGLPSAQDLQETTRELLRREGARGRFVVNTVITRGPSQRGLAPPEIPSPNVAMRCVPAPSESPPIHALIAETVRRNEGSPLSRIKSLNYGDNILAMIEAQKRGGNQAIMINNAGNIACAASGNLFIMSEDRLITPPLSDGAMDGIIRRKVIEHFSAKEASITPRDLEQAIAVYLCNSVQGVLPLASLNGKPIKPPASPIDRAFHLS